MDVIAHNAQLFSPFFLPSAQKLNAVKMPPYFIRDRFLTAAAVAAACSFVCLLFTSNVSSADKEINLHELYDFSLTSGTELSPPSKFKTAGSTKRTPRIDMRPRSRRFWKEFNDK